MGKHGLYMPGYFPRRVVVSNILLHSLSLFLVALICQDSMDRGVKLVRGGSPCLQVDADTAPRLKVGLPLRTRYILAVHLSL
jgi:hypothetical protein